MIITGTRKGLGAALARHYLDRGYIVAGCSRSEGSIEHENYSHYQLDVADEKAVAQMVRSVARKHGRVDVLINNAGIASMNHFMITPASNVSNVFNTNYIGSFLFMREVSKVMLRKKYGRIINFTTVAKALNLEGESNYAASKAAVESLTKVSAKELGEFGITVNAVGPNPIPTDLINSVSKEKIQNIIDQQAIKREGTIEDVIHVLDFFMDENSSFISGQIMYLGGINS